jgi:UDP-N-acetylglucosamine:LPS N-acetylglucosamine transferase
VFFVSTLPLAAEMLEERGRVYIIGEADRHRPLQALGILLRSVLVVLRERPDVVLTTGSMPLAILCMVAKCFGSKIIWIDSITNVEQLSMSGRYASHFADLCLTQWPHLTSVTRHIEYAGGELV